MEKSLGIRPDYSSRAMPQYDDRHCDDTPDVIWQPDVYFDAREIAFASGSHRIIDIGCGTGDKLLEASRGLTAIGLDYGPNIEKCAERHVGGSWRPYDIDGGDPLPISTDELANAVLVCADVVEHVVYPANLMHEIRRALDQGAMAAVMSTPDRELVWGRDNLGPPPNLRHVREWTRREFAEFLRISGISHATLRMTRENSARDDFRTIEAILTSTPTRFGRLRVGPGIATSQTRSGERLTTRFSRGRMRILRAMKAQLGSSRPAKSFCGGDSLDPPITTNR